MNEYFWVVWHRPTTEWRKLENTAAFSLTNVGASNRHIQIWDKWSRQLGLSGGWLYIERYQKVGDRWNRDRCDFRHIPTMQFHACA